MSLTVQADFILLKASNGELVDWYPMGAYEEAEITALELGLQSHKVARLPLANSVKIGKLTYMPIAYYYSKTKTQAVAVIYEAYANETRTYAILTKSNRELTSSFPEAIEFVRSLKL